MDDMEEDLEDRLEIEEEDIVDILRKFQQNREEQNKNAAVFGKPTT